MERSPEPMRPRGRQRALLPTLPTLPTQTRAMPRTTEARCRLRAALIAAAFVIVAAAPRAVGQSALLANQARPSEQTPPGSHDMSEGVGGWPKISFGSVA